MGPCEVWVLACRTAGVDETRALGGAVAALVDAGDVVVLVGDLGAGKTAFVQGFAASLGVTAPVTSPTFTLANRYEGRLVVNHLDVYRFDRPEEVSDLALPELLDDGVTLVEWGDTIASALPAEHLSVTIRFGDGDDDRSLEIRSHGEAWRCRGDRLRAGLERWVVPC
jgi:tRNA threonylcarbamoyladenosine biosynthesis protein TsaE